MAPDEPMTWQPATIQEVEEIVAEDLANCDSAKVAIFRQYAVPPHYTPILRFGQVEQVVVVARKGDEVIYWEDVEEGFNLSAISTSGVVLEHGSNQDCLRIALNHWVEQVEP